MFDLVTDIPLNHVYKEIKQVKNPSQEASRLLKALFACIPDAKAVVVVVGTTQMVEELASEWEDHFDLVWKHGKLTTLDKALRTQSFIREKGKRVLLGTKLVPEGIDVRKMKMMIMLNHVPNMIQFMQQQAAVHYGGLDYFTGFLILSLALLREITSILP